MVNISRIEVIFYNYLNMKKIYKIGHNHHKKTHKNIMSNPTLKRFFRKANSIIKGVKAPK